MVVRREIDVVSLDRNTCSAKVGSPQALLRVYRDACKRVDKNSVDEGARIKNDCVAAANKMEDEVSHFVRVFGPLMKDGVSRLSLERKVLLKNVV